MYANHVLVALGLFGSLDGKGGPGRGLSHNAAGMVNKNHHAPMTNSTTRNESVVLFIANMMTIDTHCRNKPALYPIPIPVEDI